MGRAPWPVTVVLRLVSPGAKQVGRPEENRHLRQSTQSFSSSNGWVFNWGCGFCLRNFQGGCSNNSILLFDSRGFEIFFPVISGEILGEGSASIVRFREVDYINKLFGAFWIRPRMSLGCRRTGS